MNRRRLRTLLIGGAALALAVAVGAGVLLARDTGPAAAVTAERSPSAPELAGTDPISGNAVSLADFAGKPVVINVWAAWCAGCNAEAEDLREFAEAHPEVQLLGIDLEDGRQAAREFYGRWQWTWPSIFDPQGELAQRLGLQGMPSTYFLNERHEVVTRIVGATDRAGFEDGLRQATSA